MKLLVLGGSVFLGRHFVERALARGWPVTTFNRGRSGVDVPGAETVRGDREQAADLARLAAAGPWDAVVDVCGYVPRVVGASVRTLAPVAKRYAFISSINACPGWPAEYVDEDSPRHPCAPGAGAEDGDYGVLKAGCERAVEAGFGERVLVVEPGLIVGPYENIGRLPTWLRRAARGGRFVAGGGPERPIQLIDARDIAEFTLDGLAGGLSGRYLTAGIAGRLTWGELLRACAAETAAGAEPVWLDDDFLLRHEVEVWNELPMWAPDTPEFAAVWSPSSRRALDAGLVCRPVEETIRDTWTWLASGADPLPPPPTVPRQGMDPGREAELLSAWDAARSGG